MGWACACAIERRAETSEHRCDGHSPGAAYCVGSEGPEMMCCGVWPLALIRISFRCGRGFLCHDCRQTLLG